MIFNGNANEYLMLSEIDVTSSYLLKQNIETGLTIIWNVGGDADFKIDEVDYKIKSGQIFFLTEFHELEPLQFDCLRLVRFNRGFYCIIDHDSDVGCKGMLFFGASKVPLITIPIEEMEKFEILWKMFRMEMVSRDKLQVEMLQMMLKRLLILSVRIYKEQNQDLEIAPFRLDIIREFNFLVETYFKDHHDVAFYASELNKSPKTISNLFLKYKNKSPLQVIQDRIMLEARRLLHNSDKPVKEIAYALGYEDIQTFSRFFKTKEKISPIKYRVKAKNLGVNG